MSNNINLEKNNTFDSNNDEIDLKNIILFLIKKRFEKLYE